MAKYEDYIHNITPVNSEEREIELAIEGASEQQEDRASTPDTTDWEERYNNLEKAYSKQGQQMGDYRALIDDYVSTPAVDKPEDSIEVSPITPDDIYENPDEAVRRAVDSHPAILKVRELEADLAQKKQDVVVEQFEAKHPDWNADAQTPEFANWVKSNPMRFGLMQRADSFDMIAADALFTMWEAEHGTPTSSAEEDAAALEAASLESGYAGDAPEATRYSRSEMFNQKVRAKQGDLEAEAYVKGNAQAYREALEAGTVRD